jgi:hypothetical protein
MCDKHCKSYRLKSNSNFLTKINLKKIRRGSCFFLVDLTQNDPMPSQSSFNALSGGAKDLSLSESEMVAKCNFELVKSAVLFRCKSPTYVESIDLCNFSKFLMWVHKITAGLCICGSTLGRSKLQFLSEPYNTGIKLNPFEDSFTWWQV